MKLELQNEKTNSIIIKRESQEAKRNLAEAVNNVKNIEYQKKQELELAEQEIHQYRGKLNNIQKH